MLATLKMSNLGGFSVAEIDDVNLQNKLFDYFRLRLTTDQIDLRVFEVNEKQLNLINSLAEMIAQTQLENLSATHRYQSIVFFVHGLEKLTDTDRKQFFQFLDLLQDRLTYITQPVVIWSQSVFVKQMAEQAPNFWRRKGAFFTFPTGPYQIAAAQSDELSFVQQYIAAILHNPDYTVWRDLYFPLEGIPFSETASLNQARQTYTDQELAQLTAVFPGEIQEIDANQIIFNKDDQSSAWYVLLEGKVEVVLHDALNNEVILNRLSRGDFFGEIALIKRIPRTATVRSVSKCRCLVLTREKLRVGAAKISNLWSLMETVAEHRMEIIGHGPPDVMSPLRRFANQENARHPVPTPTNIFELIVENRKTIILGGAGTGKTTLLQALTLDLIEKAQDDLAQNKSVRLPIFIKLSALKTKLSLEDLIFEIFQNYGITQFENVAEIRQYFKGETYPPLPVDEFIFIMDGLNEMQDQAANREMLNDFIQLFSEHCFIISCRSQEYSPISGFQTILLQQLRGRDIETFLIQYVGQERGERIAREIYSDPQLIDLARIPIVLYIFTQLIDPETKSLPRNRGVLFNRLTDSFLERIDAEWWKIGSSSRTQTPLKIRKEILANLSLAMQEARVTAYPEEKWLSRIPTDLVINKKKTNRAALLAELKFSGLIHYATPSEKKQVEFAHPAYQEFFAALALRDQNLSLEERLTSDNAAKDWYGVVRLLYGISPNPSALFSQILGQDNAHARIWLAAQCLTNSGEEIAVATERFEESLPPEQHFAILFSVGLASYLLGRYPEALTYLLRAAEEQPGNAEVQYELGTLYRQVGQYERAIHHLEQAFRLHPGFVDAYNQLGITYYDQEKYEETLTIFTATTQLEPTNAYHYYNLGSVQKIIKDYQAAQDTFRQAVQLKEDYPEARVQLDILDKALSSGVIQVLKSIPMLSKLTLEQTIMLANRLNIVEYQAGQIVFHLGETGETFYIIEYGHVEVLTPSTQALNNNHPPITKKLNPGDFFGEIALLRAVPRTATIRCLTEVRLLELHRSDFTDIINNYPSIAYNLVETSSYRLLDNPKAGGQTNPYYNFNYLQELLDRQDEVTVLMGDIHGSSFLTHSIGPELMVDFLNEYLLHMSRIIVNAGGAVDKSLGDSVMGVFGKFPERAGETSVSPAIRSLLAGLEMRQAYLDLREQWRKKSPIFMQTGMGIGINTGPVKIGTVGAEGAMVGAAVNISSKLSKLAVKGRNESEIYIDRKTYNMLGDSIEIELVDPEYVLQKLSGVELEAFRVVRNIDLKFGASSNFQ